MKKKLLFSLIALTLVALIALPLFAACAGQPVAPAKDKIIVGMSRPLSGPLASIGDSAFRPVYETWVPDVNAQGGIYIAELGKKLPIELKIYDDKSDVGTMTRLTEKLILEDKVDFLWPACGTAMLFAQAPIANKYGYILMTYEGDCGPIADMLTSLPYVFPAGGMASYEVPALADLLAEKGVKTAYITYIADLHGIWYSGVAGVEFARVGIKILGSVSLPPDLKDFAPVIADAKASGADVFCCFAYPDQVMPVTGTAMALGYNPKAMVGGPCVNFGFYHTTFGPAIEGVLGWGTWNRKTSPECNALADKLYTGKPEELNDWWSHIFSWGGLDFQKAAIEKAGTLDQKKIRDIIATEAFNTVMGPNTRFVGGMLSRESRPGFVGQWQNGVYEIVAGRVTTAPFEYPKPAWPAPPK